MFEITCDNCGGDLMVDQRATANEYLNDMNYSIDEASGKLVEHTIQQYLLYTCMTCRLDYKFTYKDWESRTRRAVAEAVMELRKQRMFRTEINPQTISADNGMSFCGQCSGYAGDGNCLNDVIKQCTIRKKDV